MLDALAGHVVGAVLGMAAGGPQQERRHALGEAVVLLDQFEALRFDFQLGQEAGDPLLLAKQVLQARQRAP